MLRATVVVVHNTAHYIALHYLEFIEALIGQGYRVMILAPRDPAFEVLRSAGAECCDFPLSRLSMNPLRELYSIYFLFRFFRRVRPQVVFNYSTKPVIYSSYVAGRCGVPCIFSMMPGLGHVFARENALKSLVLAMYRRSLKYNRKVFFQNSHDRDVFVSYGLIERDDTVVVNGTGIDLKRFRPGPEVVSRPVFLLVSRMLWEKGVREFVDAANALKARYPDAEFRLLGPVDDNPSAIPKKQLEALCGEGVKYLGETADVRPHLQAASVFVLPSYYREGMPRSIIEAMAMGKPVITTDWPGCREPVEEGVSGFLVAPRDIAQLESAMEKFIVDEHLARAMGRESRRIAERDYNVDEINKTILSYFPDPGALLRRAA